MKTPEQFRFNHPQTQQFNTSPGDPFGRFVVPKHKAPHGRALNIIACDGIETGWDHVSVSLAEQPSKTPSWGEMCFVKALFWEPNECVVQFHPAEENYVNTHVGVLHLWKQVEADFPMPPTICV